MHPDIVETKPGTCPLCKMNLVAARLDAAWMCPLHAAVIETAPGSCRLCARTLVPVTVSLAWTCRGEVNAQHLEPGLAPTARRASPSGRCVRTATTTRSTAASSSWRPTTGTTEGTYPRAGSFRLFVYDDYARALNPAALGQINGRLVAEERYDPATKKTTELRVFPLCLSKDGLYLEADPDTVPGRRGSPPR